MSELLLEPLVECTYGWGRLLRLYPETLDVHGTSYALSDLVQVYPVYHHVMGIASARLEFVFRQKNIVVRGIAEVDAARKIVAYLLPQLTQQLPSGENAQEVVNQRYTHTGLLPSSFSGNLSGPSSSKQLVLSPCIPAAREEYVRIEQAQAATLLIEMPYWRRAHYEQYERRLRRLQTERSLREHGFDVAKLEQQLRQGLLMPVRVPIRLLPGEYACYRTEARRCDEPVSTTSGQERRKVKDYGTLILTNERMIYLGRRGQILLGYAHLLYVSRLRRAVMFMAEHWAKREIFEMSRPLECAMYLEHILQRFKSLREPCLEGVRAVQPIGQYVIQTSPASEGAEGQPAIAEIATVRLVYSEPEIMECEQAVEETR